MTLHYEGGVYGLILRKLPKSSRLKVHYSKKTIAGHVVELLEMSSKPKQPPIKKISADEYVNTETGEVHSFNRSQTRADNTDSLRKTFKLIRDTVNANCTEVECLHWVTLTYAENMTDTLQLYNDFKAFWKRFKRYCLQLGRTAPEYITVIEPQKRGAWHCHCLFIWQDGTRPFIPNKTFAQIWAHGFVRITSVDRVDNIGAYLSAYLGDVPLNDYDRMRDGQTPVKDVKGKKYVKGGRLHLYPPGMKLMRTSRGIKRPSQEVVAPETIDNEKILAGACTFRGVIEITDEQGKTRQLAHSYYNTQRKVCQAQSLLQSAILQGITCTPMEVD